MTWKSADNTLVIEYVNPEKAAALLAELRQLHQANKVVLGKHALVVLNQEGIMEDVTIERPLPPPFPVRDGLLGLSVGAAVVVATELFPVVKDFVFGSIANWTEQFGVGIYLVIFPTIVGALGGFGSQLLDSVRRFIAVHVLHDEQALSMPRNWNLWQRFAVGGFAGGVLAVLYVVYTYVKILLGVHLLPYLTPAWAWLVAIAGAGIFVGLVVALPSTFGTWLGQYLGVWLRGYTTLQYQDVLVKAKRCHPNTSTVIAFVLFRERKIPPPLRMLMREGRLIEQHFPPAVAEVLFLGQEPIAHAKNAIPASHDSPRASESANQEPG